MGISREIKFRAFDKTNKKMVEVGVFDSKLLFVQMPKNYIDRSPQPPEPEMSELMQFTGLKDKNGEEIYEASLLGLCPNYLRCQFGDMSNCLGGHRPDYPWEVQLREYDDDEQYTTGSHFGWICFDSEGAIKTLPDIADKCEVIGNIYQNPELLKK